MRVLCQREVGAWGSLDGFMMVVAVTGQRGANAVGMNRSFGIY